MSHRIIVAPQRPGFISLWPLLAALLGACTPATQEVGGMGAAATDLHAYVWAGGADSTINDALLVLDMDTASATYGRVIAEHSPGVGHTMPHHIERHVSAEGLLIANSWMTGTGWVFDVRDPAGPVVHSSFTTAGPIGWPHDFTRLPNGNVLVAYNRSAGAYEGPGGVAELNGDGAMVQTAMAGTDDTLMTPYTIGMVPGRDRAVVGLGEMGMGKDYAYHDVNLLQLWSTAPLKPLALITMPPSGTDRGHIAAASVEHIASGEMFVNTFYCGLYHVAGLDGDTPAATRVYTFPGGTDESMCAVAATVGNYWIQAAEALPGLVVLDLSNPAAPREVARLVLDGARFPKAHWVSADRSGTRLAITGTGDWLVMARFDPTTGAVTLDERFGQRADSLPGMLMRNARGATLHPHGVAWGP